MPLNVDRRKVLQTTGAALGLSAIAGCLTDDDGDGGGGETVIQPGENMVEINYDEIVEGGTLRTALSSDIPNWDPPQIGDTTSNMACGAMVYEGLLTTDYTGEIHPWLATDWEEIDVQDVSEEDYEPYMIAAEEAGDDVLMTLDEQALDMDGAASAVDDGVFGMGYEFSIREGVQFHNGDELTAEHFVRSYERWVGSTRWAVEMVPWYLDARATGDYTLELYGQLPDADFFRAISLPVFPQEYWDMEPGAVNPLSGEVDPAGTGVWQFDDYEEESHVILTRFDDHWFDPAEYEESHPDPEFEMPDGFPERPPIETIDYAVIPEDPSRSAAIQDGIVDHTAGLASDTLSDFNATDEYRVSAVTSGGYLFFEYPNQQEPWDDPRMCRGVNHMIPRPQIVETVFDGWATEAKLPLSPTSAHEGTHDYEALEEELGHYSEYDPDAGSELVQTVFDERGVEAPFETKIITNSDNDDRVDSVQLIAEAMENTGLFEVTIDTFEWGRFVEMLTSGTLWENNQLICVGLSSGWTPDGYARAVAHPDNQGGACCNFTHYENETVTELIDEARYGVDNIGEENIDNRRDTYEELWAELLDDPPVSWIQFGMENDVLRDEVVRGWNTYPFNSAKYSQPLFNPPSGQITWVVEDE